MQMSVILPGVATTIWPACIAYFAIPPYVALDIAS